MFRMYAVRLTIAYKTVLYQILSQNSHFKCPWILNWRRVKWLSIVSIFCQENRYDFFFLREGGGAQEDVLTCYQPTSPIFKFDKYFDDTISHNVRI